ncbi:MAG: 3-oxoacyl-ACP reductase FabG [Candidatus Latescibacterota bacterium]
MFELSGKIALVTGAGSGIGRASAVALARAGADVVVNDIDGERAARVAATVQARGRRALWRVASVADPAAVAAMVDAAWEELGPIDILVNNAGIYVPHEGGLETLPLEAWHAILDVNLHGVFHCTQAVLRRMLPRRAGGRIINISSILSQAAHFSASSYHVSKAGVNALTRSLAVDLAPHKITVNAIGPGAIASEGLGASLGEEVVRAYRRRIPYGARGRPEDIAHAVVFLASPEARYITGQFLAVDGGYLADSTPEDLRPQHHPVPPDDPDLA